MKKDRNRVILVAILAVGLAVALLCGLVADRNNNRTDITVNQLVFSEICTKNDTIIADNSGAYRDYVEIYNGGQDVNLKGWCLTDGQRKSQPLGQLYIPSGSYCLLFVDKDVTGFSLKSSGGECVSLIDDKGHVAVQVNTMAMSADEVMLYTVSGYKVSKEATPGFPNTKAGLQAFTEGEVDSDPILLISEVLTENVSALPDENGRFVDVLELYNRSDVPVSLGSYCLSDTMENRFRYRLPGVMLGAGEYAVIYCDGENYIGENGEIHTNFGLSKDDAICLTDGKGKYIAVVVQFPGQDRSLALNSEGNYNPSPVSLGYANDEAGVTAFAQSRMEQSPELVVSEILLSNGGAPYQGAFLDVVEILNSTNQTVNTAGWYLSDGSDPYGYALPQQDIQPGGRILIPCSRETTGFALSQNETVCLLAPSGKWASRVLCLEAQPGQSIQLLERDGDFTYVTEGISLGFSNTSAGVQAYEQSRKPGGLQISELMSANQSYLKGAYGDTWDWVELYNGGNTSVNLKDYSFSTDKGQLNACSLPDKVLAPGQYCVLLLSEKDGSFPKGYSRLPVSLSAKGETLYLSQEGKVVDYAIVPALPTDISYGRAGANGSFSCLAVPTPGATNAEMAIFSQKPQAATAQGIYETNVQVSLSGPGAIYYTTDCTEPTRDATLYTGPISLTKTTVIRAVCYENGKLPSESLDLTYVVNEGHKLPVVSLVTEPDNLWDYNTGIYADGPNAGAEYPHFGANFWYTWEKEASVSLLEMDGTGFSEPCGISIFGNYSRGLPMKAFTVAFRDFYGTGSLRYPLFGEDGLDSYEAFILRCSGQDAQVSHMRDVLMTSLVAEQTTVAVQKYRPVVLYLNGEFWGVYYIREKANENYVAGNYNAKVEDVSLTEYNGNREYMQMVDYAHTHDLSQQEHYDYICSQMDIDNYIDFMIAQMYIANTDIDNIKFFKTSDRKWTWLLFDTDLAFSASSYDTVKDFTNPSGTGGGISTKLINALLKNPQFKDQFIRRIAWQMENIWSVENVTARVDELEALIGEDMKRDCQKWGRSYTSWQGYVDFLRRFPASRNEKFPKFVQSYFGLTDGQMRQYGFVL